MRNTPMVLLLIILLALLALGALSGGAALMFGPRGDIIPLPVDLLADTPFTTYMVPGALLFAFLGVYPLLVVYSLTQCPEWVFPERINPFRAMHWAWAASLATGVTLIIWIVVQTLLLGYISFLQPVYMAWGIAIVVLTLHPSVRRHYHRKR